MTDIIPLSEKLYRTGMELAIQKKDYKNAILLLKLSKLDNWETLNNIGVCYERLHQYKKAAEYYLKSNCNIGRQNYVLLARYNKIDIDSNFYRICEELIKDGDVLGYTTFTDFYCRRKN